MMAERIYTRGERGGLEPLEEEPFSTEDELQVLIAEHPELLDGEQIRPGDPRRWILITREQGIADRPDGSARWSLDHLIVDQDAVPTLAEVKRGSNRELRRTIVGQLLEYAAHAAQTWTADELRRTFEESNDDADAVLAELLQVDEEPDADTFWEKVATNLTARRLRLLFIADEIPDALEQVVKFLNEQMPGIEVLAVEIKQFRGKSSQTLVPRVIGRTAAEPRTSFSSRSHERVDMEPYMDFLRSGRPGDTLKWTLGEGEIVRRAKRRLTIAAKGLGTGHSQSANDSECDRGHCSDFPGAGSRCERVGLTPRPPLHHGGEGESLSLVVAVGGAIAWLGWPPYGPPAVQGDVDSRFRGKDAFCKGLHVQRGSVVWTGAGALGVGWGDAEAVEGGVAEVELQAHRPLAPPVVAAPVAPLHAVP